MPKIAILDDNEDFCFVIQAFLKNYWEITTFTEISSFLESLNHQSYDLVIIDFSLTLDAEIDVKNGCDLIEILKKQLNPPPSFILITGWLGINDLDEGQKICAAADAFLSKNSDLSEILKSINILLSGKSVKN
ncbi:MAG TPA: response regulator [Leptolyngbyaceae cyanobacterium]